MAGAITAGSLAGGAAEGAAVSEALTALGEGLLAVLAPEVVIPILAVAAIGALAAFAVSKAGSSTEQCPLKAKAEEATQLEKNKASGKLREEEVKKELEDEGHEVLGSQVSVKTSKTRRVVDHLIRDAKTGKVRAIEVKSGGATRNKAQIEKDQAMESEGGTIIGKNAPPELRGQSVKIPTEVVH